jgi:hypothetical protein
MDQHGHPETTAPVQGQGPARWGVDALPGEIASYRAHLAEMAKEHEGKDVLIRGARSSDSSPTAPRQSGRDTAGSESCRSWSRRSPRPNHSITYPTWCPEPMPRLEIPMGRSGPIIEVRLWMGPEDADILKAGGIPLPPPCSVLAPLDTGAERTAIHRSLARWMGSFVEDTMRLRSSVLGEEEREAPAYIVRATFGPLESPDPLRWWTLLVAGVDVVSPGANVLIGRDLLATCRFTYDGRKRRLMISY